jgi:hypothetical protein
MCYCTREDVKRSLDIKETARNNWQIDQALQATARNIEHHLHRQFYPLVTTYYWDWPNYQYAYPWRVWFDQWELADTTVNPPVVTTGGEVISNSDIFWGPWNGSPPYTYMELNRSTSAAFGVSATPQQDIAITGTFGYDITTDAAGTLAAAVSSTSATTVTVSCGYPLADVGHLLVVGSERMLVMDNATADTTQNNISGATTANMADNAITVSNGALMNVNEIILIDQERMLVVDISNDILTVIRAWDGTVLSAHNAGTEIYAYRTLTVQRASYGTTASTYSEGTAVYTHHVPLLIRNLAIAEAGNTVLQRSAGYGSIGADGYETVNLGAGLADLWDEAMTSYGRKARRRVI